MALQGFDKDYYLTAKLAALKAVLPEYQGKDTAFLEGRLLDLGLTPEQDYTLYGYAEKLGPNAYFNHDEYRFAKADQLISNGSFSSMKSALDAFDNGWQKDPYLHYLEYGASERINPSNAFDESQYLTDMLTRLQSGEAVQPVSNGSFSSLESVLVAFDDAFNGIQDQANKLIGLQSGQADWSGKTIDDLRAFLIAESMTVVDHYINYGSKQDLAVSEVPPAEQVDPENPPWEMSHEVSLPDNVSLDWVDAQEITTIPHSAIGQVTVTLNGELVDLGTGFMISPTHFVTNAHVVLDDYGVMASASDIRFSPGLNGEKDTAVTYSSQQIWVEKNFDFALYPEWPDNDLAVVKLDQPIGNTTGFLHLEPTLNLDLVNADVKLAGYPVGGIDQDNPATQGWDFYQWEVSGTIDQYLYNNSVLDLSASMEVTGGASGSPVYYDQNNLTYFTGVFAGSMDDTPVAAAVDQDTHNWLLGIVQQDGYYMNYDFV